MRLPLIALGMLPLAACGGGGGGSGAGNGAAAASGANTASARLDEAQQRVTGMAESQRNAVLIRAIRDAHQPCQQVVGSVAGRGTANVPVYLATCEDGAEYAVAIASGGNASVQAVAPARPKQ